MWIHHTLLISACSACEDQTFQCCVYILFQTTGCAVLFISVSSYAPQSMFFAPSFLHLAFLTIPLSRGSGQTFPPRCFPFFSIRCRICFSVFHRNSFHLFHHILTNTLDNGLPVAACIPLSAVYGKVWNWKQLLYRGLQVSLRNTVLKFATVFKSSNEPITWILRSVRCMRYVSICFILHLPCFTSH